MLDSFYRFTTPWASANKTQIFVNRAIGVLANYCYPIYCKLSHHAPVVKTTDPQVIVSLTTFPARVKKVHLGIESILRQRHPADMVILWLARSQFPDEKSIPDKLRQLTKHGLTIRYCEDIRSYKKVFFTAQEYMGKIIITADDDTLYPESWIEGLIRKHQANPDCVICYRAHKIAGDGNEIAPYDKWNFQSGGITGPDPLLVPIGVGGVLYPPGFFKGVTFDIQAIRQLCPTADDLWLKIIGLKKGYSVVKVYPFSKEWFTIKSSQKESLMRSNVGQNQNDVAMRNLVEYYEIDWSSYLQREANQENTNTRV